MCLRLIFTSPFPVEYHRGDGMYETFSFQWHAFSSEKYAAVSQEQDGPILNNLLQWMAKALAKGTGSPPMTGSAGCDCSSRLQKNADLNISTKGSQVAFISDKQLWHLTASAESVIYNGVKAPWFSQTSMGRECIHSSLSMKDYTKLTTNRSFLKVVMGFKMVPTHYSFPITGNAHHPAGEYSIGISNRDQVSIGVTMEDVWF